jgi:hypothetical protein
LRAQLPTNLARNFLLDRYLENLTSYAGSLTEERIALPGDSGYEIAKDSEGSDEARHQDDKLKHIDHGEQFLKDQLHITMTNGTSTSTTLLPHTEVEHGRTTSQNHRTHGALIKSYAKSSLSSLSNWICSDYRGEDDANEIKAHDKDGAEHKDYADIGDHAIFVETPRQAFWHKLVARIEPGIQELSLPPLSPDLDSGDQQAYYESIKESVTHADGSPLPALSQLGDSVVLLDNDSQSGGDITQRSSRPSTSTVLGPNTYDKILLEARNVPLKKSVTDKLYGNGRSISRELLQSRATFLKIPLCEALQKEFKLRQQKWARPIHLLIVLSQFLPFSGDDTAGTQEAPDIAALKALHLGKFFDRLFGSLEPLGLKPRDVLIVVHSRKRDGELEKFVVKMGIVPPLRHVDRDSSIYEVCVSYPLHQFYMLTST